MGMIFDKLDHKDELRSWIRTYAGYPEVRAHNEPASLEYLMRFWETEKSKYLYKMFGKKFIIEKEIFMETPVYDIETKIEAELNKWGSPICQFARTFRLWVENQRHSWSSFSTAYSILELVEAKTLATNFYDGHSTKIDVNDTTIVIQHGCKPSRILGKIAEAAGLEGYEAFRIAHSAAIGKKVQKGTLCLSIHPLDYLTMSDNTYDWDSCMRWRDPGCYRIGTVEMMNSPAVVVAYLRGSENMRFFNFEWNSKKWRNLFIITKDFITGIKGYPYQDKTLDELSINMLMDLATENLGYSYHPVITEHYFDSTHEKVKFEDLDREIKFYFSTNFMYNDFGNNNTTHMVISKDAPNIIKCEYSGFPECMYCGSILEDEDNYDTEESSMVICFDCLQMARCENCGMLTPPDELRQLDGVSYCEECFENYACWDPIEEEYHHRDYISRIYLISNEILANKGITKEAAFETSEAFHETFPYITVYHPGNIECEIECVKIPSEWGYNRHFNCINLDEIEDSDYQQYIAAIYKEYGEWWY